MPKQRLLQWVTTMALLAAAMGSVYTGESAEDSLILGEPRPISLSEDEAADIVELASTLGLPVPAATERFAGQTQFMLAVDALRAALPASFASASWLPGPGYQATVSLTRMPDALALDPLRDLPFRVRVLTDAPTSELAITAAQARLAESLAEVIGENFTISADADSATLTVRVPPGLEEAARKVSEGVDRNISLEVVPDVLTNNLALTIVGGLIAADCTGGFTVTLGSQQGMVNAAHCGNGTIQYGPGTTTATFQAQAAPANGDVQWFKMNAGTVTNKFQYTPSGGQRVVTSTVNPVVGAGICYWGVTTGNHCETVQAVNQCDGSYCKDFHATPSSIDHGDSGGPWYFGNQGLGLTHGWAVDVFGSRLYDSAVRAGAIPVLGVTVKTVP